MKGARFELFSMLIPAAIAGLGLTLAPPILIGRELAEGRLVQAHPHARCSPHGYHPVYPEQNDSNPALRAFRQWLLTQAGRAADILPAAY